MSERAKMKRSNFNGFHHPVVDYWQREVGGISCRNFSNRFSASKNMVLRLELDRKLVKHEGCVNTVSFNSEGDILISGSDDRRVVLWDWELGNVKLSFDSGHDDNIFQAKFIPFSNDRIIVTCAADGMYMFRFDVQVFLGVGKWRRLSWDCMKEKFINYASSQEALIYFTHVGEEGLVQRFDMRTQAPTKLFKSRLEYTRIYTAYIPLKAMAINPRNSNILAVGGMDRYARLYDIRRVHPDGIKGDSPAVDHFCPLHLIGSQKGITDLAFSQQSELLVAYHHESAYLFTPDMGLGSNRSSWFSRSSKSLPSVPLAYKGVKSVNFFGPSSEYVVSGTASGRLLLWRKKDAELIRVMVAEDVNCIEPHPHIPVLATGSESIIKVWTPTKATLSEDSTDTYEA